MRNYENSSRTNELIKIFQEFDWGENVKNIMSDAVEALLGNPLAAQCLVYDISASSTRIKDIIFLRKIIRFLKGIYTSDERISFCERMFGNENNREANAIRLIEIIDKINCEEIIDYVVNAGRAYGTGLINQEKLFRICYSLVGSMPEDLLYLKEHVFDELAIEGKNNEPCSAPS